MTESAGLFFVAIAPFVAVGWLIYACGNRRDNAYNESVVSTASEIAKLNGEIATSASGTIHGKEIKSAIGVVTGTSGIQASSSAAVDAAEKEALLAIMQNALDMGANAVVDLKMNTTSYQRQGSQWMVSKVFYTGTAVRI